VAVGINGRTRTQLRSLYSRRPQQQLLQLQQQQASTCQIRQVMVQAENSRFVLPF